MDFTGPQIISELRDKLQVGMGRHLYGVLGTYAQLAQFERADLASARDVQGQPFPEPLNLNRALLARIADADLRSLVHREARRPQAVQRRLNRELDQLLSAQLQQHRWIILKHLEILFAHNLDFGVLRTRAVNQHHILLLLPGQRYGEQLVVFHEAEPRFHRTMPRGLLADNHLWTLR